MEITAECHYRSEPALVTPSQPTPRHTLYLSNLDDQHLLRNLVKYVYVFTGAVDVDALRTALADVLVNFYPLAGRLRPSGDEDGKLVVDCNAEGALFAEGFLPHLTAGEFLRGSTCAKPHESWRKLLCLGEGQSVVGVPLVVIQVNRLGCGGTVLCAGINHCLCDGIGGAHFLHAWARAARSEAAAADTAAPCHDRRALMPRCPPQVAIRHPEYSAVAASCGNDAASSTSALFAPPLVPVSLTFTAAQVLHLKESCAVPPLRCTSFEALAAHVWRAWVRSHNLPREMDVKLLFPVDVRRRLRPELPAGYYGNGIVLGCAEATVGQLMPASGARHGAKLVKEAKDRVHDEYVRSTVDLLQVRRGCLPDLSASLGISAWTRLGLLELDFGAGTPVHMGPLMSETYCVFLPVIGDPGGVAMLVSVPQATAERFAHYCLEGVEVYQKAPVLLG